MYDIKNLEENWETYNKRRKLPLYIAAAFLVLFILITVLWFNKSSGKLSTATIAKNEVKSTNISNNEPKVSQPLVEVTDNQVVLDTTNNQDKILQKHGDDSLLSEVIGNTPIKDQTSSGVSQPPYSVAQNEPVLEDIESLKPVETSAINKNKKDSKKALKIDISNILTTNAFQDVEDRFYETKDTDDSLFLARSYFKRKDYNKALFWALQTNKVNDSIEEAWLIFAESKYKMGDKAEARKILNSYIQRSDSVKARGLLESLK